MFTKIPEIKTKIPVPSSPQPLRRQNSLRLKDEKRVSLSIPSRSQDTNHSVSQDKNPVDRFSASEKATQSSFSPRLQRGRSFMERTDRGVQNGSRRPDRIKIGHKSPADVPKSFNSPESPGRIRSLSLSLSNARLTNNSKSPSITHSSPHRPISSESRNFSTGAIDDWDTASITSIGSINSVASCDHSSVACNGTTFSGRSMKYVFHCNQHAGAVGDEYLTPTQRAQKQVRKLKHLLQQAKKDLEEKDSDILKLTKEVVELRLYKAALGSPEDKSNSSDAITVRENTSNETTPEDIVDGISNNVINELNSSLGDSGHFEDCTNSSVNSKDSVLFEECRSPSKSSGKIGRLEKSTSADLDAEHRKLIEEYERRFQELIQTHEEDSLQMKQKHNEKVEELLQRISEINSRYWQLVPELEEAKERIKELEYRLEEASKKLEEQTVQAAGTSSTSDQILRKSDALIQHHTKIIELAHQNPTRVSVPELLNELQVTRNELENIRAMYRQLMEAKSRNKIDPEITLQFLKSAVYYFLTDKENSQGHLKAIQSILGFSSNEISNIEKARLN